MKDQPWNSLPQSIVSSPIKQLSNLGFSNSTFLNSSSYPQFVNALIKVISDIIDAADGQQVTLLGLLDMSAAFDTVDHDILLHRFETSYGVRGRALRWLTSFLTGRTQAVSYAGRTSPQCRLSCGVPQGSVLGPLLFVLYTADVIGIAMGRGIRIHVYADDTQIYVSCAACWPAYRKSNPGWAQIGWN